MIRKFIQCKNTKERMELFLTTNLNDWTENNLNTVMEIFGMNIPEGATKEDKWELISLFLKTKEAADMNELGYKLFHDSKEDVVEHVKEEQNLVSDLNAYAKVCDRILKNMDEM